MSDYYESLLKVIKKDKRFVSDEGILLRNRVYEAGMSMDKDLIHALMRNAACRKVFFTEIDSVMVFDKVKFGWIVSNRQFLPDSYTRFKNKIGLVDTNGDYISGSRSVELVFPYKDCVLEGGQTKEEQKRQEIFYNETLAPDEVDRLLAPKVMTNAILHQKGNNRRALEITDKDNLIIMGNNLLSLSSMLSRYEEKIKCVYIDPPYNTGSDAFQYNDRFNKSSWLLFMKNRLGKR